MWKTECDTDLDRLVKRLNELDDDWKGPSFRVAGTFVIPEPVTTDNTGCQPQKYCALIDSDE